MWKPPTLLGDIMDYHPKLSVSSDPKPVVEKPVEVKEAKKPAKKKEEK